MATDKDPEDLLSQIIHEWQRCGGILLRVKKLQSFESDTILAFYNIFTPTPKKYLLQEFYAILREAQSMAQEIEPTDYFGLWKTFQATALFLRWSSASRTLSSLDKIRLTLVK